MPIPWLSLLKVVPWTDVIAGAPAVADGAKRLWQAVAIKTPPAPAERPVAVAPAAEAVAQLQGRLATLEATVSELHDQMLASSELIKALADQNAELIKRVETNRIRLFRLSGAIVLAGALAALGLALALAR